MLYLRTKPQTPRQWPPVLKFGQPSENNTNKFTKLRNLLFKSKNNTEKTDNQNVHDKIASELTRYMSEPAEPEESDPLAWWKSRSSVYPYLSKTVKFYMCVQATSVSSERAFSLTGNLVTKKRNRLLPENVIIFTCKSYQNSL